MKIQTLFSFAAVGLAFANPIHNLEERGHITDIAKCVGSAVQQGTAQLCSDAPKLCNLQGGLNGLTSCITNAAAEVTDTTQLTQDPLGWALSLDCSKELLGGVDNTQDLQYKLQDLKSRLTQTVSNIVGQGVPCLSLL
ncbi:hypothetical protein BDV39DRAFT_207231 [Aspergillus sergii]|uniref:Uncharacterized protein n=1 Tax=Aspergillus sergii TaxID=1034303 RepID=A0A5N6WW23_9EURO|nr:hypothetical protein BDV39DRAFT_207231 [Aspergillus sergii]